MSECVKKKPVMQSLIRQSAIVIPDTHGHLIDRPAFSCIQQAIQMLRPEIVIHLGDLGEWESNCSHNMKSKKPDPAEIARRIRNDARGARRAVLDPLDEVCARAEVKRKIMLTGNHDDRLDRFVKDNPDYASTSFDEATGYKFGQIYDWSKRQWQLYPIGKLLKIGDLHFYHGHLYGGINHTRNHLLHYGVSIMYGHWHDVQYSSVAHSNGIKGAWSIGCVKVLAPEKNDWLGHRPVNWGHAFAAVHWYGSKGHFTVNSVNIINGQCVFNGQFIDGNKPGKI